MTRSGLKAPKKFIKKFTTKNKRKKILEKNTLIILKMKLLTQ
jgi:hypothetical protein